MITMPDKECNKAYVASCVLPAFLQLNPLVVGNSPSRRLPLKTDQHRHTNGSTLNRQNATMSDTPVSRRAVLITLSMLPLSLSNLGTSGKPNSIHAQEESSSEGFITLPCEGANCRSVEIRDYRVGTGREVQTESTVVVKWTGRLADRYGWPFQLVEDDAVTFMIGRDRLVRGFVQGILGMREGGKRRLLIPGELGYQDELSGPLPSDFGDRRRLFGTVLNKRRFKKAGDLVIDVELKRVRPPK